MNILYVSNGRQWRRLKFSSRWNWKLFCTQKYSEIVFKEKLTHNVAEKIFSVALLISKSTDQLKLDAAFWIT